MLDSISAVASPALEALARLAARARRATRREERLDAAARERLEQELSAAVDEMAPAYHGSREYCRAVEALASLHLSVQSGRFMRPVGAICSSGTSGAGSGSSTFADDATLS